jgi:hypothetical protein
LRELDDDDIVVVSEEVNRVKPMVFWSVLP